MRLLNCSQSYEVVRVNLVARNGSMGLRWCVTVKPPSRTSLMSANRTHRTAPANHTLDPNEVTIEKEGLVMFVVNGGAQSIAIYRVSKSTSNKTSVDDSLWSAAKP